MYQTELDSSGRRAVKPVENSEFIMDFDTVIYAIGNDADDVVKNIDGIELNKWNNILVNETFASKDPTIFAAGDIVTGSLTVVNAMASGKKAAHNIHEFLKNT